MTAEVMKSKICSIMLLDEEKQELEIRATQSLSSEYRKKPNLKIGQGICGKVAEQKNPVSVLDVRREREYMFHDIAIKEGFVSILAVPMMLKGKVIGVINSYTSEKRIFSDEEKEILLTIANQAAIAVENAKLMQEALSAKEALKIRKVVEKAKGIIMEDKGISENDAHKLMQKKSMNTCKPVKDIAEAIVLTREMVK